MKRKTWSKIILLTALSLLFALILMLGILTVEGYGISIGRLLVTERGSNLLIVENTPIQMSDRSQKQSLFDSCQTGDLLLVVHGGVEETYPAKSGAIFAVRLQRGSVTDIPEDVLNQLFELGWFADISGKN